MHYFKLLNASKLSAKEIELFKYEFDRLSKKTWLAYVLFVFTGGIGGHEFYLNQAGWGVTRLVSLIVMVAGIVDSASSQDGTIFMIGMAIYVFMSVKLVWDLFTIPETVRKMNRTIEKNMLESITGKSFEEKKDKKVEIKAEAKTVESSKSTEPASSASPSSDAQILNILGWFFGCSLIIAGVGGLFTGEIPSMLLGLSWIVCGLWAVPPLAAKANAKLNVPTILKIIIITAIVFIGVILVPIEPEDTTSIPMETVEVTE